MGYRSKVIFGVEAKDKEAMDKILEKHELLGVFDENEIDGYIVYVSDRDLKWYPDYKDVFEINEFIDDEEDRFMVCLGEDNQVHDERGCWWDFVYHESYLTLR